MEGVTYGSYISHRKTDKQNYFNARGHHRDSDYGVCRCLLYTSHTNARIQAAAAGTRIATMPGITKEMFSKGAMTADYTKVEKLTDKITAMLTRADTVSYTHLSYIKR